MTYWTLKFGTVTVINCVERMHKCKILYAGYPLSTGYTAGLLIADVPHIWCTRKATLLQWAMQFMKHFAWGVDVISFCSLLISPLLYYVSDVRPERDRTIFNHQPPFVASQSWKVATIGGLWEAILSMQEGHKIHSRRSDTSGL